MQNEPEPENLAAAQQVLTILDHGTNPAADAVTLPQASAAPAQSEFGKYELIEEIGRGGMGVVYKARQKDLDRIVALKMILSSNFASQEQIQRFHVESKTAAKLNHPNIVQIHEAGQIHGQSYFAMEFVEGTSLAALLRRGPLPVEACVSYLVAVARGVAYLHAQGIVHRDLKPANILLASVERSPLPKTRAQEEAPTLPYEGHDNYGLAKITDFGLVKLIEGDAHMTNTGAIVGTPSYMAPEQAAGRPDVGPLCDVYSLGAILYEMLTGRPPFHGDTPLETLGKVLEGEATLPSQVRPGIPRELELICLKCLDKAPERRYSSASELVADLERFLRGEPVAARSRGLVQRLLRWGRREPALLAHLAVLALCFSVSHVYYLINHQVTLTTHLAVLAIMGLWGLVSVVCQALLRREWRVDLTRTIWLTADAVLLTLAFALTRALTSPILICYALFIAASGLWFRVQLVWLTTALSALGYLVLLIDADIRELDAGLLHHQILFLVGIATLGFVVAYQVQRVRVLSRYYENRPLV